MSGLAWALALAVRGYQLLLRPFFPPSCRFEPSCSHYAIEALHRHGAARGSLLAARRILRCHPWGGGAGYDPVPPQSPKPRARLVTKLRF